jgi:putative FmdB family regulatory protein
MPMYEYRCEWCARPFESYRSAAERGDPADCPACQRVTRADRLWSPVLVKVRSGPVRPRTGAEALAGGPVKGLGSRPGHRATSVLQSCGGLGHVH